MVNVMLTDLLIGLADYLFTQTHENDGLPVKLFCFLCRCVMCSCMFWVIPQLRSECAEQRYLLLFMTGLFGFLGLFFLFHAIRIFNPDFLCKKQKTRR